MKLFFNLLLSKAEAEKQGKASLRVGPYYGFRVETTHIVALIRDKSAKHDKKERWITVATAVKERTPPSFMPKDGAVLLTRKEKKTTTWEFHDPWRTEGRIRVTSFELSTAGTSRPR